MGEITTLFTKPDEAEDAKEPLIYANPFLAFIVFLTTVIFMIYRGFWEAIEYESAFVTGIYAFKKMRVYYRKKIEVNKL